MEKKINAAVTKFEAHKSLLTQPVTERVKEINEFIFENFARKSITKFGFFPVLRFIEPEKIYIKFYFYYDRVGRYQRDIEDFVATLYVMEINKLYYVCCNFIRIHLEEDVSEVAISQCRSMEELESLFLNSLTDKNHIGVGSGGNEGSLTVGGNHVESYRRWKDLLNDGNIKPGYNAWRLLDKIKKQTEEKTNKVGLQLLMLTGGVQPTTADSQAIDTFYTGNVSKAWAMNDGFVPKFRSFENGRIHFDLITDHRSEYADHQSLCKYIAKSYEMNVTLLRGATSFEARHFKANDIIGFHLLGDEISKLEEYNSRVKASYDSLPDEPYLIHGGTIAKW